jgi:hypothetical protein
LAHPPIQRVFRQNAFHQAENTVHQIHVDHPAASGAVPGAVALPQRRQ